MKRLRRPQRHHSAAGLALATVLLLTACTGRPSLKSTWGEGNSRHLSFTRLLVVGVSPDYAQRCNFEYWLVRDLRSKKLTADASCNYMNKDEPLSREGIERVVATLHSDGVLATRMVASDWIVKEGASRDTRGANPAKGVASGYDTGFYGVYGTPVDYYQFKSLPSLMNTQGTGHVVTKLYETGGASLVYTIDTKVKDVESSQLGLAMVTPAIAERLRRDRLIH